MRTMLRVAAERDVLKVKDEGFISPTYARDLAEGIAGLVETELYGRYHLTNSGSCFWYEFTREIVSLRDRGRGRPYPKFRFAVARDPTGQRRPLHSRKLLVAPLARGAGRLPGEGGSRPVAALKFSPERDARGVPRRGEPWLLRTLETDLPRWLNAVRWRVL